MFDGMPKEPMGIPATTVGKKLIGRGWRWGKIRGGGGGGGKGRENWIFSVQKVRKKIIIIIRKWKNSSDLKNVRQSDHAYLLSLGPICCWAKWKLYKTPHRHFLFV